MAAGVAPQSSWILNPTAPPRSWACMASRETVLPLPSRPMLTGSASRPSNIRARCQAPGVTVVALVPSAGPVPPPTRVVMPGGERLVDDGRRDEVDVGVDGPGGEDLAVARDDLGLGADDQIGVDAVHGVGVAGLAERGDPAVADADVGLDDAPVVEHDGAGDDGVGRAFGTGGAAPGPWTRGSPCRRRRRPRRRSVRARRSGPPRPRRASVGVGEPDRGRRWWGRTGRRRRRGTSSGIEGASGLAARVRRPRACRRAGTSATSTGMPGSKRTAVPAAMFRRRPRAARAVELQAGVGLGEVVVGADLDGPVGGVEDGEPGDFGAPR